MEKENSINDEQVIKNVVQKAFGKWKQNWSSKKDTAHFFPGIHYQQSKLWIIQDLETYKLSDYVYVQKSGEMSVWALLQFRDLPPESPKQASFPSSAAQIMLSVINSGLKLVLYLQSKLLYVLTATSYNTDGICPQKK